MLDVIQAVDGPVQLNVCLHGNGACERAANCLARPVWARAQEAMLAVLGTSMIATWLIHRARTELVRLAGE
jgi:DNA-binding IscR family transcriptional regulator